MKVSYKNNRVYFNLVLGVLCLLHGSYSVSSKEGTWFDYSWFAFSFVYLVVFFYKAKYKYLTLENGFIKQNWPFGKKMKLSEISQISLFSDEYILKSKFKKMRINTNIIHKKSLIDLKEELKKLDVLWI